VSSRGQVKSVPRVLADGREHGGALLTQTPDRDGYLTVHLRDGGRERRAPVHVLVLEAFRGPRPDGMEGCHGPQGQLVNDLDHLRWDTPEGNVRDRLRESRMERENGTAVCSPFPAVTPVTGGLR
jgi:hypothetical protein